MVVAAFRPRREPRAFWLLFLAAVSLPAAVAALDAQPAPGRGSTSTRSRTVAAPATPAAGLPVVLAHERCLAVWPSTAAQARDPQRQGDLAMAQGAVWVLLAAPPEATTQLAVPAAPASVPPRDAGIPDGIGALGSTTLQRLTFDVASSTTGAPSAAVRSAGPPGTSPTLAVLEDGSLLAATLVSGPPGDEISTYRSVDAGATWSGASLVLRGSGFELGRLVRDGSVLWLPVLDYGGAVLPTLHLLRSHDGGVTWNAIARTSPPVALHGAQLAVLAKGRLVCVARHGKQILAAQSRDAGVTWSAFRPCGLQSAADVAVAATGNRATLLYTEIPTDTTLVPPAMFVLRQAVSDDAGVTWQRGPALVLHPGWLPRVFGAACDASGAAVLTGEISAGRIQVACRAWPAARPQDRQAPRAGPAVDSLAAQRALRILAEHTVARPHRAPRLFVEAYFMRTLAAAHGVLAPRGLGRTAPFDSQLGVDRAVAFADTLLVLQDKFGYWPLGYHAVWYADMGAAAAIFPAVEPYVDAARLQRYEAAMDRFLRRLASEKMLWDTGAVGLGRELVHDPLRIPRRASSEPYLVSTALVGIECRAWMYHRTRRPEYRDAALKSLDYSLSQITAAGFLEPQANKEGVLRTVAYVQEGWMAADLYLDDASVLPKLRRALRPHVAWILSLQKADGTWDGKGEGTFARTPAIVNFLLWYDQRCESRAEVRAAIARAAATWTDPDRWSSVGLLRAGEHHEVQRALVGRTLAALAAGRPAP